jgi:transposase
MLSKGSSQRILTRAEIRGIYAQGEEAVITLVEELLKQISKHESELRELRTQVEAFLNHQAKDSHNSSKPPSSNGFKKPRTSSLRQKSGQHSGGQPGHPGSTLEWVEQPDVTEVYAVQSCEGCGLSLIDTPVLKWELSQVHDLPPLHLQVTEHRAEIKCCPHCQTLNRGVMPSDITSGVQYGSRLKGFMAYLSDYQLLPSERSMELLSDVLGCNISEGTLYNARQRCFEELEPVERQIIEALQTSPVTHFDETGARVKGKLFWLHVSSTSLLTYYFIHGKRGSAAMDEMGVLPQFKGTSIHDGFKSYAQYDCLHGLCNAHHLRELVFISERYEQPWPEQMIQLLLDIKAEVEESKKQGLDTLASERLSSFEFRYQDILSQGFAANPPVPSQTPKSRGRLKQSLPKNLLDRLQMQQSAVLRFMYDFRVPFDNNQGERDLRMVKVKQKISGGFRSLMGGQIFCRIRGYISTLKKQRFNILDELRKVFMGNPTIPVLTT